LKPNSGKPKSAKAGKTTAKAARNSSKGRGKKLLFFLLKLYSQINNLVVVTTIFDSDNIDVDLRDS